MRPTSTDMEDVVMTDGPEPSEAEIEAFRRSSVFEDPEQVTPDQYPRLWNVSAGSSTTGLSVGRYRSPLSM